MISQSTVDRIFEATRVEEVVGDFVSLRRAGANMKGLSPFTSERTPSFTVSPAKQIWKDFSSGKGGNAVTFLMEHEHFTYPEALRYLAKKYNIEVEETQQNEKDREDSDHKASLYLINRYAADYFRETLLETEPGRAVALEYFKERGLLLSVIQEFELGYAPDSWDGFSKKALEAGYKKEYLEELGLISVKDDKVFDRFRGRVMFPIHSMSGRVLGFGGRTLLADKSLAKYVNSSESMVYHKSHVLYGLYQAKQFIAGENHCYLTEGYMDVIQLYQAGIRNVVASSGTALTEEQIRLIRRLTPNITILYDGDAAGQKAALKGIDMILEQDMNVRVCPFPSGEDPDSFVRKHAVSEVLDYLSAHTQNFIRYKARLLGEQAAQDPILKAEALQDMVSSISKITDPIKRELYIRECAEAMAVSEASLSAKLAQLMQKARSDYKRPEPGDSPVFKVLKTDPKAEAVTEQEVLERNVLKILLLYGSMAMDFEEDAFFEEDGQLVEQRQTVSRVVFEKLYTDLQEDEIEFANEMFKAVYEQLITHYNEHRRIDVQELMNRSLPEEAALIGSILMEEEKYALDNWERKKIFVKPKDDPGAIAQMIQEVVADFRLLLISKNVDSLLQKLATPEENTPEVMQDAMLYTQLKNKLFKKTQRRIIRA